MAYRRYRRGYGRKRYGRKKRMTGTWGTVASTAKAAYKTAKFVAGLVNVEKKYFDTNIGANLNNAGYTIKELNLIAQGDDETNRNGRSILAKALFIRMRFNKVDAVNTTNNARIIIFRDKAQAGTLPAMSDIYSTVSGDSAVVSLRNILTGSAQRYDILVDKIIRLENNQRVDYLYEKYIKLNSHIHFIGTTGATASMGNGSLYMAMICEGDNTTARVNTLGNCRLRYIDN